jgi:hypothetical protein
MATAAVSALGGGAIKERAVNSRHGHPRRRYRDTVSVYFNIIAAVAHLSRIPQHAYTILQYNTVNVLNNARTYLYHV